jgi:hypothetical protein
VEVDYSGLHVNLLYGLQGIQPPKEDHYEIEPVLLHYTEKEQRKIVKGLVLNAINASSIVEAIRAYQSKQPKGSKIKNLKHKQLRQLLDAFVTKHPIIGEALGTDKGVELMKVDGRITAKVINHFTKKNIPILSIHDSYVIQNQYSGQLRTVMMKTVAEELDGLEINMDQEGIGRDQIQAFKNMDRANALDYDFKDVTSYERTEGYKARLERHNKWLLMIDDY